MTRDQVNAVDRIAVLIASFGFCGFFPIAPATFASAVTAVLLLLFNPLASWVAAATLLLLLLVVGTWSSGRIERIYGHDPSAAVIDEVLGMTITMLGAAMQPFNLVLGFVFFRFFDIVKVPPGRALERLPGGWGVMMDDVMAGVYGALALQIVLRIWPEPQFETWHGFAAGAAIVVLAIFGKPLKKRYGKKRSHVGAAFGGGEPR